MNDKPTKKRTEEAAAALKELVEVSEPESAAGQVNRLLPLIEQAIASGIPHSRIVETLNEHGIEISLNTFRGALYRARRRAEKATRGERRGRGVKPSEESSKDPPRCPEPLVRRQQPKSFNWDPTARPNITFIGDTDED